MRKFIIAACLGASALMILDTMNAGHALVMFVFVGILPGTDISISASRMLEIFALLIGFTLARIVASISNQSSNGTILSAQS